MTGHKLNFLTILGIGNILRQDDGFGVHFITWFSKRYCLPEGVRIIDGGTLGYGLFDVITCCKNLIVIDTIKVQDDPGSVYRFTLEEMGFSCPFSRMADEVEFTDVLCKAELIDRLPETTFLCIVPQRYDAIELQMSPVMHERYPAMEQLLIRELAMFDLAPVRAKRVYSSRVSLCRRQACWSR